MEKIEKCYKTLQNMKKIHHNTLTILEENVTLYNIEGKEEICLLTLS